LSSDGDAGGASPEVPPRPRVLLADDYKALLVALRRLLAPSCDVVGTVGDGLEVVDAAARLRPDVIVLDVNLPTLNGLEACRRIKAALPRSQVILITAADDDALRKRAFELGACAFVLKHRVVDDLGPAIHDAFQGGSAARGVVSS
jgi:DNA-binding NarL/FixJ family response regulator